MIVIHSKDLVNWEIINHVVDDISFLNPDLDSSKMNGYYNGIWAGSLRFHDGIFYCHFTTPKGGWFVATTDDIRGKWTVTVMTDSNGKELRGGGWDDVCPLWDDDGQAYIIASNFGKYWFPHLFKMSPDGTRLLDAVVDEKCDMSKNIELIGGYVVKPYRTAEAAKLYKFNGMYYIYFSEVRNIHGNRVRVPVMRRSKSLYGPYEEHLLMHSLGKNVDKEPNQGAILEGQDGKWWFVTHHGTGDFDGRVLSVVPVEWKDDWPDLGIDSDNDGVGEMVWEMERPVGVQGDEFIQTSDSFDLSELGHQWEFNHQPSLEKWSLSERPGYLRIYASPQLRNGDFFSIPTVVSQRYIRWGVGTVITKMDISAVKVGQEAGLAFFNGGKDFASIAVVRESSGLRIIYRVRYSGEKETEESLSGISDKITKIWLKASIDFNGKGNVAWSTDGRRYHTMSGIFQLKWGSYRGARIGLFTFDNNDLGGYVDFDFFDYSGSEG